MNNQKNIIRRLQFVCILIASLSAQFSFAAQEVHLEGVLGTSLDLTVYGVERKQLQIAVKAMSKEAARLESILSSWQKNSSLSVLNHKGKLEQAPKELRAVLMLCDEWHDKSKGMFSCRMGGLKQHWQQAKNEQVVPDRVDMRLKARNIQRLEQMAKWQDNNVTLATNLQVDPAGIAKGYIIDLLMNNLRSGLPSATGIKLDIGGDMLFWGVPNNSHTWSVGVNNETHDVTDENATHIITVPAVAVASSGHQYRYVEIERRKFSHILQPDDGWPMDNAPQAVVIAPNAATADAIATALSTQPASQGIDWVNTLPNIEAAITTDGIQVTSKGWHYYMLRNNTDVTAGLGLHIEYQIPTINQGKYHRPYLAVWITDTKNKIVRNVMLLGESERWAKENTRWWRRVGRKIPGVLEAIARPTRLPGKYHLTWNYLDDQGQTVTPGKYWLHMEAAREGGGHDYQKVSIDTANDWENVTLAAKGELGSVTFGHSGSPLVSASLKNAINMVEVRP